MKTKIISFFADNNHSKYYSSKAKILIERCKKFGVSYDIRELESKGSYMLNCLQKPHFIKDMMKFHNCPLIWIDCDTDFRHPFNEFDDIKEDIGFATHSGRLDGIKASPLFFNNNTNFDLIIDSWIQDCEQGLKKNKYELDHDALKSVTLPKLMGKITIKLLDKNYIDFVNGKYISNGNSVSNDKRAVLKPMQNINKIRERKLR